MVNILSLAALASLPTLGGYSASKAAAYSMTQALRAKLKPMKIEVLAALPGVIDTDMVRHFPIQKPSAAEVAKGIVEGIARGDEEIFPDVMSRSLEAVWKANPKGLEHALANMNG
jgi:short-subunit dehydrogenase